MQDVLEPGERVVHAFRGSSGRRGTTVIGRLSRTSRAWFPLPIPMPILGWLLGVRNYIVAVTNRNIVVVRTRMASDRPLHVSARLPRDTLLGPLRGNGWIKVAGITMYVWDVDDLLNVQEADAEMGYPSYPPPSLWWGGPNR